MTPELLQTAGQRTISMEIESLQKLHDRIDQSFIKACQLILDCPGRVIVLGIGKSGHIARKIAATLASTGTPAFFVHPAEANHGDFGMITEEDVVITISNSGNAHEILSLMPLVKRKKLPVITMTGNPDSPMGQAADVILDISVETEACPLDLAPTSSTTATLVMGDALAMALLEAKDFTSQDFAFSHPGGSLGKRLLTTVADLMHTGDSLPIVGEATPLKQVLLEMSTKGLGITTIVNDSGQLSGVFTDGDLRRTLDQSRDVHNTVAREVMCATPSVIKAEAMAITALNEMEEKSITTLVITNDDNQPTGIIHLHDLLKSGIV